MRKPQGYATVFSDAALVERDTVTCGHCGGIVRVKPGTVATVYLRDELHIDPVTRAATIRTIEEPGAMCRVCMKPVCLTCEAKGICTPLMKQIELMEAKGRMLAAVLG